MSRTFHISHELYPNNRKSKAKLIITILCIIVYISVRILISYYYIIISEVSGGRVNEGVRRV